MAAPIETTTTTTVLTWENPRGGDSHAKVVDGVITELTVEGPNNVSIVISIDAGDLAHLNTVLTDLLAFIEPL